MIRLVVDSGSQITPELREKLAALVVPITVTVDGVGRLEGVEIDADGITEALERAAVLGTSTPSPGQFLQAYEQAAAEGATEILSVHAGGQASGTANAAQIAAGLAPIPVEVVDTSSASFPVTLCAWAAGDVLTAGGSLSEAAAAARAVAAVVDNVFIVGALPLAQRGGRLATGTDPSGIPVFALADGVMKPVGKVTETGLAVAAMVHYVVDRSAGARIRVGVGHLGAQSIADDLESALHEHAEVEQLVRYTVGPSVAVHSGLGTVGCVFHRLP